MRTGGFRSAPHGFATGDLGWLAPDGQLYLVGRRDRQVKIRGCRVELAQVEAALLELPGVRQAAVWADRKADGEHRVLAAVVPNAGHRLTGQDTRIALRERLPHYMVPALVAIADSLPLNANGKLDGIAAARLTHQDAPVAELPPVQNYLRRLWSTTLGGELAGPDDDFFALGGDSLAVNTVLAAIAKDTGVVLAVGDFLAGPTIRALAERLA